MSWASKGKGKRSGKSRAKLELEQSGSSSSSGGSHGVHALSKIYQGEVASEEEAREIQRQIDELEIRLNTEEEMNTSEDFRILETEFLKDRENPVAKLKYSCNLIRSKDRHHKTTGLRHLYDLEHEKRLDAESIRTVLYYLALGNFRLARYQEAKRFCAIMLEKEPKNRQSLVLLALIFRKMYRKYCVVLQDDYESELAFDKALEMMNPGDELVLTTHVDPAIVEGYLTDYKSSPAYFAMKEEKTEDMANRVLEKYKRICDARDLPYSWTCETGDAKEDMLSLIEMENIDTVLIGIPPTEKKGFFSRVRNSNLSDFLFQNAKCNVYGIKKP